MANPKVILVMKTIVTTRATYRLLAAVLIAFGVTQGASISSALEIAVCALSGCG